MRAYKEEINRNKVSYNNEGVYNRFGVVQRAQG